MVILQTIVCWYIIRWWTINIGQLHRSTKDNGLYTLGVCFKQNEALDFKFQLVFSVKKWRSIKCETFEIRSRTSLAENLSRREKIRSKLQNCEFKILFRDGNVCFAFRNKIFLNKFVNIKWIWILEETRLNNKATTPWRTPFRQKISLQRERCGL